MKFADQVGIFRLLCHYRANTYEQFLHNSINFLTLSLSIALIRSPYISDKTTKLELRPCLSPARDFSVQKEF